VSEELLKGEFEGKDTIQVDCTEVAGKKQLVFTGLVTVEPVAAGPAEGPAA
jgi:ATP-dependent Clp protease ATP-binding subunit ClpC